jgi:citrate synthase
MHLKGIAKRYIPNKPLIKLASKCLKYVPPVLEALGKVQNPWPNVDAHSGVLLH